MKTIKKTTYQRIVSSIHLIAFFAFLTFFGCSKNKNHESVEILGKITNCPVKEITIYNDDFNHTFQLNELGEFKSEFKLSKGDYFTCSIGKQYAKLYLLPGDKLKLTVNFNDFYKTLFFSGFGSKVNNYLIRQALIENKYYVTDKEKFTLPPAKFKEITDKIYKEKNTLLEANNIDKNKYADFLKTEHAKTFYNFTRDRLKYKESFQYFTKKEAPEFMDDYYSFIEMIDFNDSSLMKYTCFRETLKKYVEIQSKKEINQKSEFKNDRYGETKAILQLLKQTFSNELIYNWLLKKKLENKIARFKVNDSIMNDIQKNYVTNEQDFQKFNLQYQKSRKLQKGMKAPNFTVYTVRGDTVKLTDFKGKFVYIDVWSTYCGPCIREMPEFLALSKEYDANQIVFLCISIDNKKEQWLSFIKKRKLKGLQLFARGRHSDFSNDYLIEEIPRNILIDREGDILDIRAARPVDIKIRLNKILNIN